MSREEKHAGAAPKTKQEKKALKLEVLDKTTSLATAGFGLVAALAWNNAIQTLFNTYFPEQAALIGKFIYAVLVTVLVVLLTTGLGRTADRIKKS